MTRKSHEQDSGAIDVRQCPIPEKQIDKGGETITRGVLLAVDTDTVGRNLADFQLVLGPAKGGQEFTVFRSTSILDVPAGSCLRPSLDTMAIVEDGYQYNVLKTAFVPPDELEHASTDRLIHFPPGLQDGIIIESAPTSPELWQLLVESETQATHEAHLETPGSEATNLLDSLFVGP